MSAVRGPAEWSEFIASLQRDAFLVGPVQEIREIPEGFDITCARVMVDVEGETFWVGKDRKGNEERALGKSAIERIATAAGASVSVQRTDDRAHPRRCEYSATAIMRLLDGSSHLAQASRAYDMTEEGTDWISTFDAAAAKAYAKALEGNASEENASAMARDAGRSAAFAALGAMHRNAETKARLRALRALLGIRAKYFRADLERKHFAVLRLSATGRSSDPHLRQEFSRMLFANAIGATHALFGSAAVAAPARALPAPPPPTSPIHTLPGPDEVIDAETGEVMTQGNRGSEPSSAPHAPAGDPSGNGAASSGVSGSPPAPASPASPSPAPTSKSKPGAVHLPGHPEDGKPFTEASDAALSKYLDALAHRLESEPEGPRRVNMQAKYAEAEAELWRRKDAKKGEAY